MYRKQTPNKTSITVLVPLQGEPIEAKLRRIMQNNEPITDKAPIVYTERKDGVMPEYDIRTDKWEIAVEAKTKIANAYREKRAASKKEREDALGKKAKDGMKAEGEAGPNDN